MNLDLALEPFEWLVLSLGIFAGARYFVCESVLDAIHAPVERWLSNIIDSLQLGFRPGEDVEQASDFRYYPYGLQLFAHWLHRLWTCPLCVGQWISFFVFGWTIGAFPWEWRFVDLLTSLSLNVWGLLVSVLVALFKMFIPDDDEPEEVEEPPSAETEFFGSEEEGTTGAPELSILQLRGAVVEKAKGPDELD